MTIFEIPCFVQIEDKDTRKEVYNYLKEIGYKETDRNCWELHKIIIARIAHIQTSMGFMDNRFIDCGTNIPMFKALAAINDENDLNQWWYQHTPCLPGDDVGKMLYSPYGDANPKYVRKATPAEIVEYFNIPTPCTPTATPQGE